MPWVQDQAKMSKVIFREAAASQILPFYGELHRWAVLLKKLSRSTNEMYQRSRKFICNSLIETRSKTSRIATYPLILESILSQWEETSYLFTLRVSAHNGFWREDKLIPILKRLKQLDWWKYVVVSWPESDDNSYRIFGRGVSRYRKGTEEKLQKNYMETYQLVKSFEVELTYCGEVGILMPLKEKIERVTYLKFCYFYRYPLEKLEELKKDYLDTGRLQFQNLLIDIWFSKINIIWVNRSLNFSTKTAAHHCIQQTNLNSMGILTLLNLYAYVVPHPLQISIEPHRHNDILKMAFLRFLL